MMRRISLLALTLVVLQPMAYADFEGTVASINFDPADPADWVSSINDGQYTIDADAEGMGAFVNTSVTRGSASYYYSKGSAAQCSVTVTIRQTWDTTDTPNAVTLSGEISTTGSGVGAYSGSGNVGTNTFTSIFIGNTEETPVFTPSLWGIDGNYGMSNGTFSWSHGTGNTLTYQDTVNTYEYQEASPIGTWDGVKYKVVAWAKSQGSCQAGSSHTYTASSNMTHTTSVYVSP
nr:hypothetical protein [Armatimonas sp.]